MSGHTPGPWVYNGNTVQSAGRHYSSTLIATTSMAPHFEQAKANARLIAAAPELLEALIDAQEALCDLPLMAPIVLKMRAAIAKATGEQQ